MIVPEIRVSSVWWSRNGCPMLAAVNPSSTNTDPNPAMNNAVVPTIRRVCTGAPSSSVDISSPVTIAR